MNPMEMGRIPSPEQHPLQKELEGINRRLADYNMGEGGERMDHEEFERLKKRRDELEGKLRPAV